MSLKRQNVKRKAPLKGAFELLWSHTGSNRGPTDYENAGLFITRLLQMVGFIELW